MNRHQLERGSRRGGVLLPCLMAAACGILGPDGVEEIRVINRTDVPIHVQVWELETAYLVDPAPSFTLDPATDPVLEPGTFRRFQPEEVLGSYEPGEGLGIFVFEVQGEVAYFRTSLQLTGAQLRHREGRVPVKGL